MSGWKTIWQGLVEPQTIGGISWGQHMVVQKFQNGRSHRPSKGWRRHVRRMKAAKKAA